MAKPYLGIVDWGVGGIGIYKLVKSELGNVPIIYLSDTGVTPYGKMARQELISRLNLVIAFLRSQGVGDLVIGCNAASTVIPTLDVGGMRIEGVIQSAVDLVARMHPLRLALIGGRRTVLSGVYRRAFADRGVRVRQRIAQPLSGLIESGDTASPELRDRCRSILSPVADCTHLLLACTHYPAIIPVLREFVSEQAILIDPARALVNRIKRWKLPGSGKDIVFTSGNPDDMKNAAWHAFGIRIRSVSRAVI